jgi:hypothetical protein
MKIGYGRVSTRDQNPDAQRDALTAAGCDQVFIDKASGKLARRPELDKALLSASRAGDQLVVTKLDRLGRSLDHLISLSKHLQASGVDLVVLDQGIDTSTAVGRIFFQILGAIAEFEHGRVILQGIAAMPGHPGLRLSVRASPVPRGVANARRAHKSPEWWRSSANRRIAKPG